LDVSGLAASAAAIDGPAGSKETPLMLIRGMVHLPSKLGPASERFQSIDPAKRQGWL
jgi:hypothetical protein